MTIYIISRHKWPVFGLGTEPIAGCCRSCENKIINHSCENKNAAEASPCLARSRSCAAVIYLPPWLLSRPAFSIEYDFGQSIYEIATSVDNSSNLNQSNLILMNQ